MHVSTHVGWRVSPQILAAVERPGILCRQGCPRCASVQVWELYLWAWHEDEIAEPVQTATDEHPNCELKAHSMRTSGPEYILLLGSLGLTDWHMGCLRVLAKAPQINAGQAHIICMAV